MNVTDVYEGLNHSFHEGNASDFGILAVGLINRSMNLALNWLTIIILILTMISLGCSMEVSKMKHHFLHPKGVCIAILSQFCIMPFAAFFVSKILQLSPIKAVSVLIAGCCPGGTLSNVYCLALKGDLNLSILMTTCSSIAALVLMPLLLLICSQGFPGLEKAVPYTSIMYSLILSLLPCCAGIALNHYRPKYSAYVQKVGICLMIISGVAILVLSHVAVGHLLWMIFTPDILTATVLLPAIGFTLGYFLASLCKFSPQCCRTISLETGCQNVQLCTAILKVSFSLEVIGPMFLFPLLYITVQCCEALIIAICFRWYDRMKSQPTAEPHMSIKFIQPEEEKEPRWQGNNPRHHRLKPTESLMVEGHVAEVVNATGVMRMT